ncbi:MAG TPA: hypothetical protein VF103_18825 [Polyangiaceae bacterium]
MHLVVAKRRCSLNPRATLTLGSLALLSLSLTGCEVIKGIFKAGVWVGVLGVLAVVVIGGLLAGLLRK